MVIVLCLFIVPYAHSAEINASFEWTHNGIGDTLATGFKMYRVVDGVETLTVDVTDGTARTWTGSIEVDEGRNIFHLTAYNATEESGPSNQAVLEYMEPATGAMPPPTVMIRFN